MRNLTALGVLGVGGCRIGFAMLVQHLLGSLLHLGQLALEVFAGAGLGLAGVGRKLDPINGEHVAANQALAVTQGEDLGEELGGELAHFRD